jgi:hypothetical protein
MHDIFAALVCGTVHGIYLWMIFSQLLFLAACTLKQVINATPFP